jgi:hypothetical protein
MTASHGHVRLPQVEVTSGSWCRLGSFALDARLRFAAVAWNVMSACLAATRDMHLVSGRPVVVLPRVPVATAVYVGGARAEWNVDVTVGVSQQSRRSRVRSCDDHSP